MEKIELTKNTVKKFYNTPVEISLWNGCFNKAKVSVTNNRNNYTLEVCVTHPLLYWQCGNKNQVSITCQGVVFSEECIPEELNDLVSKMRSLATMEDAEAYTLSEKNKKSFYKAMMELGIMQ